MEKLLDHWDLLSLVIIATALLLGVTIAEILRSAGISSRKPNYGAITSYAVLSGILLFGISTLRSNLEDYADVDNFLDEMATVADNRFARERLMQFRPVLEEFKTGQITTGSTSETIYNLMGAYEAVQPGMTVIVVNGGPLLSLEDASNLRAAETAAALRGASIWHIEIGEVPLNADDRIISTSSVAYSQAKQLESFRLHGSGAVFSFGGAWFAEVNIVQSGGGESAKGRFIWGQHAEGLARMVEDISQLAAQGRYEDGSPQSS